jgi:hypothetical protein
LWIIRPQTQVSAPSFGLANSTGTPWDFSSVGRTVPGHRRCKLSRRERLFQRRGVIGVDPDQRTLFAHHGGDLVKRLVGGDVLEIDACLDRAAPPGVPARGKRAKPPAIARVPQHVPAFLALQLEDVGAVGDRGLTPVKRRQPGTTAFAKVALDVE